MIALAVTLALTTAWLVVGWAALAAFWPGESPVSRWLLAPAVGVGVLLLPVFLLNRAGLAVAAVAPIVTGVFVVASALLAFRSRSSLALRDYAPFAGLLLVMALFTARPMIEFGFNWVSYANDDMANYILFADRYRQHGFYDIPNGNDIVAGINYSLDYWFLDVQLPRPGAATLLAWVESITGLPGSQAFMPLIVGLHIALLSAACALVHRSSTTRGPALLTCIALGLSALNSLGVLYQLLAQVLGLAIATATATLLFRPLPLEKHRTLLRRGALVGVLLAVLVFTYPEILPFLIAAGALFAAVSLLRTHATVKPLVAMVTTAVVLVCVVLNSYVLGAVSLLLFALQAGQRNSLLFPYYLIPSGLAELWGFLPIAGVAPGEPWQSISILLGGALLVVAAYASIRLAWHDVPVAILLLVMLGVGVRLFIQRSDFGLFKLALFVQPFLLGTLCVWWWNSARRLTTRVAPFIVLCALGLYGQTVYLEASRGNSTSFISIPGASAAGLNEKLADLATVEGAKPMVIDTSNPVLAKLVASATAGVPTSFWSQDFLFTSGVGAGNFGGDVDVSLRTPGDAVRSELSERHLPADFKLLDPVRPELANSFEINTVGQPSANDRTCGTLVRSTRSTSVINRREADLQSPGPFVVGPCDAVSNHLIFINSALGENWWPPTNDSVGLFQLGGDPLIPGSTAAGVGRYALFQALNPSSPVRLALELTESYQGDGQNALPPAQAIGSTREQFPLRGRGSARVFSPPLSPQMIRGQSYVGIDMGVDGHQFPERREGLMSLYGTDVQLDRRVLVGLVRDISLVSDQDFHSLAPPSNVATFPQDLTNPDLQYSGMYEDGWTSEDCYFGLTQANVSQTVSVRGVVPLIADPNFRTRVQLIVDGTVMQERELGIGDFEMTAAVSGQENGTRIVEIRFSQHQTLPAGDGRVIGALLRYAGFD